MSDATLGEKENVLPPPAEVEDVELYHAKSWLTKYVFSQDAKVIAIQYAGTAIGDRTGRAGAVVGDAAAARLPRRLPVHRRRAVTTSSSPCTA